jgi:endonuclease/exonuclease/phosphatase family metal-dependent hydrolase
VVILALPGGNCDDDRENTGGTPVNKVWTMMFLGLFSISLIVAMLLVVNTFLPGKRIAISGVSSAPPADGSFSQIKLMAYNIRWCKSGADCLNRVAGLIDAESPDIVFLAATFFECSTCEQENQVAYLAEKSGFHAYAFGENYSLGLPFFRNRSGNAILSRTPLTKVDTQSLPGGDYDPRSHRRAIWAETEINGQRILLAAVHNSYSPQTENLLQTEQLMAYAGERPVLIGGDFNTTPDSESMTVYRESWGLQGDFDGAPTYPLGDPDRRLDYILAPGRWQLVEHKTITSDLSAHFPVISTYKLTR